jgi:hypothetical protein
MESNSQKDVFIQRIINLFHHHTDQTWISFDEIYLLFQRTYNLYLTITIEDFQKSNYFRVYYGNSQYYIALPLPFSFTKYQSIQNQDGQSRENIQENYQPQNTQVNVPSTIQNQDDQSRENIQENYQPQNTQVNIPSMIEQKPQFFTLSRQVCKEIQSVEELITAISEIMQERIIKSISGSIDISDLSSQFYKIYRQPIRSVIKKFLPDLTLRQLIEIIYLNDCEHNLD